MAASIARLLLCQTHELLCQEFPDWSVTGQLLLDHYHMVNLYI